MVCRSKILFSDEIVDGFNHIYLYKCVDGLPQLSSKRLLITSQAWNWQQYSMAQWADENTVALNLYDNNDACIILIDCESREIQKIFRGVFLQLYLPKREVALSINTNLINSFRPEYSMGLKVSDYYTQHPDILVSLVDKNGIISPLLTCLQAKKLVGIQLEIVDIKANHISRSPSEDSICLMIRHFISNVKYSSLIIYSFSREAWLGIPMDSLISHYCFYGEDSLAVYGSYKSKECIHLFNINWDESECIYVDSIDTFQGGDAHPVKAPQALICDTYPDFYGIQRLYSVSLVDKSSQMLLKLPSLRQYRGPKRVDLHPKISPSKNFVSIDIGSFEKRSNLVFSPASLQSDATKN